MGPVQVTAVTKIGDTTYRIQLPLTLVENGPYHFALPSTLRDAEGFPLDQNANCIPGEPDDGYSWDMFVDTVPPRVTNHTPSGDIAGTIDHLDFWFSETIDKTTLSTADVSIVKPNSQTVAASSIQEMGYNRFRISFPAQTVVGTYHVKIGPNIADLAGNLLDQDRNGTPGQASDVYDATFNLVQVDLGLSNLVVNPTQLWAGDPATVSWSGSNKTGTPLMGNWTDAVYFSTDDKWDISDTLLATVPHTGGLAQNQPYSGSASVVIPGRLPGNYYILVRADVANQERETNEADNVIASASLPLGVHELPTTGVPASGTLTPTDRADYYAVHVTGGQSVGIVLDGHATTGTNLLYVSFESIPSRQAYDYGALASEKEVDHQDRQLAFTAPPGGGTYYVMAYGDDIDGATGYDLSASSGSFVVTSITPDRGSSGSSNAPGGPISATVTVSGAGFSDTTSVDFIGSDDVVRVPTAIHLISSSVLTADLSLATWPAGVYDVRIQKDDVTYTRPAAFTVVADGAPHLKTQLILPNALGGHAGGTQTNLDRVPQYGRRRDAVAAPALKRRPRRPADRGPGTGDRPVSRRRPGAGGHQHHGTGHGAWFRRHPGHPATGRYWQNSRVLPRLGAGAEY